MSEILMTVDERRIEVYQDNYSNWRWVAIEAGEAVERSAGYFDTREDALLDAEESAASAAHVAVDGVSADLDKLPPPPKINTLLEAQRGGYEPQKLTPEQEAVAEATRAKLRAMQDAADATAQQLVEAEKALTEEVKAEVPVDPNEGMGLDGGPSEKAPSRARARGKKDAAPVDAPDDPLAKQVASRLNPEDE